MSSARPVAPDSNASICRECVQCHAKSPAVESNYTLISTRHGWRLSRSVDANGRTSMRWFCPRCWKKQRNAGE